MAVAKHDDPIAFVASHEAAVTDLGLTKGVHGSTGRQEVAFVRKAGLGKEGGFGRLLNPVQVEDAGRGIGLLKLGIDTVGKIGAVDFCRGVFGTLEKEKTALFVKGGGIRAIIAGGHETGHGRENVVPGVGLLAKLAETLEPFATFLRKVSVVFGRISNGKSAELLELAGGFGFTGGGQTALNRRDTEASQKPDDGHDDQELDEGKSVLLWMIFHAGLLDRAKTACKNNEALSRKCNKKRQPQGYCHQNVTIVTGLDVLTYSREKPSSFFGIPFQCLHPFGFFYPSPSSPEDHGGDELFRYRWYSGLV